ncbi:MAG: MBOAT family protein [Oscillatoriales cyanobacterium]|nr:MAG: MBOAT family protein [Oscillatoriales cyanobacterium]
MTFISLQYALFLLVLFAAYWLVPLRWWRLFVMLAGSLIFYASLQIWYIPLLLIGVVFNYCLAMAIGEPLDWRIANESWNRRRLLVLWLGIGLNVLLLLGFKYVPFFLSSIGTLLNWPVALDSANWVKTHVIAPLGLSFFCFECIAYLIDVYRGAPAATSLLHFAAYKLFFPKLISGPITRYHNLIYQLKSQKFPTPDRISEALWTIAFGAVKKGLFADNLGIYVDLSFTNLQRAGSEDLWLAIVAYGLQLYLDFSGYVDMARGTSIADFWRRWHMTLGDWLRNYLYFPLGGSRVGLWRTCLNLSLVMLIAGIWHGAAWGFIVWGGLHGLALAVHRVTDVTFKKLRIEFLWENPIGMAMGWLLTQTMVFGSWIFFRLPDLKNSGWAISHLWGHPADVQFSHKVYVEALGLERIHLTWILAAVAAAMLGNYALSRALKLELNWPVKLVLVPLCLYAVWMLAPEGGLPYIYFDF